MTYTFEQLKEDVRKEAEALRVHATKEELEKLDFDDFDPSNEYHCIYGQMCNGCNTKRAAKLISLCAIKYFNHISPIALHGSDLLNECVAEDKHGMFVTQRSTPGSAHSQWSAIEAYILLPEAKNANLIAFLKGETDNLEL
jgi:hypothetical protein